MENLSISLSGEDEVIRTLFFTDVHISGRNPRARVDNFVETVFDKLKQVVKLSKDMNCDFVLFGGDLFDSPSVSNSIAGRCARIFREFSKVIGVAGNHDLFGNNIDNIKATQLGLFEKAGLIDLLYRGERLVVNKGEFRLQISGTPSHFGIDSEDIEEDYVVDVLEEGAHRAIHIVHGMLMEKQFNPHMKVVTIDSVAHTFADLTLSGHYHRGFNTIDFNGRLFANPGSLSRVSADMSELRRRVGVLYIEASKDGIATKFIPLSQASGEALLDRSRLDKAELQELKIGEFMREIKATSFIQSTDIRNIVRSLADNQNLDARVVNYALEKLSAAEETMGD